MKTKNIILYIIICLIVIAGIAVWDSKGFNTELQYSSRYEITLANHTGIDISEIENIANEVLNGKRHFVQKVEIFGNAVAIASFIPVSPSAQIISISLTPLFLRLLSTPSQYFELSFWPTSIVRTSLRPSRLIPSIT